MYNNSMKKTYVHHNANDADFTLNNILDISNQGFWDWNVATGHVYRSIGWFHMLGYDYDTCKNDVLHGKISFMKMTILMLWLILKHMLRVKVTCTK